MTLPEAVAVSGIKTASFTIAQAGQEVISKSLGDLTKDTAKNSLSVTLTQEETLKLDSTAPAEIQLKIKNSDNSVIASQIIRVAVNRILDEEVI